MTDVLVDGRVIPVPPGWVIRVTLERVADAEHPVTRRGGSAGYTGVTKEPHDGGARPAGTEHVPTIDEIDPLPVMAKRNGNGAAVAPAARPRVSGLTRSLHKGKPCGSCGRRCGNRSRACPACGHPFPPERRS